MSIDLSSQTKALFVKTFTANQTATEITLPRNTNTVTIGCEQHDIYWSHEGTHGQALGADKDWLTGGAKQAVKVGRGKNRTNQIYIATKSSSSALVTLIFEET
jgi:hypothetical protein